MITLLSSTVMMGLSHDEAVESHRLQRETIWDIPVMDTLRLWKRSMGSIGSGKVKLQVYYTDGEKQVNNSSLVPDVVQMTFYSFCASQHYNITEVYHSKILENTVGYSCV
jgi:hypothetical protein